MLQPVTWSDETWRGGRGGGGEREEEGRRGREEWLSGKNEGGAEKKRVLQAGMRKRGGEGGEDADQRGRTGKGEEIVASGHEKGWRGRWGGHGGQLAVDWTELQKTQYVKQSNLMEDVAEE